MYRDIGFYIIDILIAIDKIKRYIKNTQNADELLKNELIYDAVLRELTIIGEAVNYLIKHSILPSSYRKIVDFRNIIAHVYFSISHEIVWEIITKKIYILENDLINFSNKNKIKLNDAIENAKKDFTYNKEILNFLNNLKDKL